MSSSLASPFEDAPPADGGVALASPADEKRDREHLHWLSLSAYVLGTCTLLLSVLGLLISVVGAAVVAGAASMGGEPQLGQVSTQAGVAASLFFLLVALNGALTLAAGRLIRLRRRPRFVRAVALLNYLSLPFGTLWGVLAMRVLNRPTIAPRFDPTHRHPFR